MEAKRAQRVAEAINRAADRAEAQVNAQARKDKAASKQRQQVHETAKAEQQRKQKVSERHFKERSPGLCYPVRQVAAALKLSCLRSTAIAWISGLLARMIRYNRACTQLLIEHMRWGLCRRRSCLRLKRGISGCPKWAAWSSFRA